MPTYDQCHELIINTTREWVGGFKFTSNSDTSKYITLPAGGFWWTNTPNHANSGSYGYYWSASVDISYPAYSGYYLRFKSSGCEKQDCSRFLGMSIRGVAPAQPW